MTHSRVIRIHDYSGDCAYIVMDDAISNRLRKLAWSAPERSKHTIIAETVLALSWIMLFEIVRTHTHDPFQDDQNVRLQLKRCLHCHARCYLKSFANICIKHCRTVKMYDYSSDGAYIIMGDAIWNRLQLCALPIPGQSESMVIAEMAPTLSWTMLF